MTGGPRTRMDRGLDDVQLSDFASLVLAELGRSDARTAKVPSQYVSDLLIHRALDPKGFDADEVIALLLKYGLTAGDVIEDYVPAVARKAGALWVEDKMSFGGVSVVGSAMQALCQTLSQPPRGHGGSAFPKIMVASAPLEQHILGAVVLAGKLRRLGCSVRLLSGRSHKELCDFACKGRFDAVLISCANGFTLDNGEAVIRDIRRLMAHPPRLVIGGAIAEISGWQNEKTEADVRTSEIDKALTGLLPSRGAVGTVHAL